MQFMIDSPYSPNYKRKKQSISGIVVEHFFEIIIPSQPIDHILAYAVDFADIAKGLAPAFIQLARLEAQDKQAIDNPALLLIRQARVQTAPELFALQARERLIMMSRHGPAGDALTR
jgi:hypothetical protein